MHFPPFLFWGVSVPKIDETTVKEFPGKNKDPTVYVTSEGVTTTEHMKVADIPLDQYLRQVVEEARKFGDGIFHKYEEGGEIGWFPCGTADIVLRWNQHRDIIKLFQSTASKHDREFWTGWFGRLFKTSTQGWWWSPPMRGTQAMRFQEEVCRFIRDKLIFKDIKVDVRTYID